MYKFKGLKYFKASSFMFWDSKHMVKTWWLFCDFALCFKLGFLQCANEYFLKHKRHSQSSYGANANLYLWLICVWDSIQHVALKEVTTWQCFGNKFVYLILKTK